MVEVSGHYLKSFFDACVEHGARPTVLLDGLDLPEAAEDWVGQRFPGTVLLDMLQAAAADTCDTVIGVRCGQALRPNSFQDVGTGVVASANLREGLAFNTRFQALTQTIGRSWMEVDGDEARIIWQSNLDDTAGLDQFIEAVFAGYAAIGRWLVWQIDHEIARMEFRHPTVAHADVIAELLGCEPHFDAERDQMVFAAEIVERPLPTANPQIVSQLTERLEQDLARLTRPAGMGEQVSEAIQAMLGKGPPTAGRVAARLGLSERTLRRRLMADGTNFTALLKRVRMEACRRDLGDGRYSMAEIAQRLGYSEQSAFARAFRDWFGKSPGEYRDD
jgi:AraC-like DNA-binding protein